MSLIRHFVDSLEKKIERYQTRNHVQDVIDYIAKTAPKQDQRTVDTQLTYLLDAVITDMNQQFQSNGTQSIAPEEGKFTKELLGIKIVNATYRATDGRISDLSTLQRIGPGVLSGRTSHLRVFTFTLGLKIAKMEFGHFELHWGLIRTNGKISIEAQDNAFNIQLRINMKDKYKAREMTVSRVELTKLGNFKISVTGFGEMGGNSVAKRIINLVLNKRKDDLKRELEQNIINHLNFILQKFVRI